jgi:undecaprenyl-phosphate 4-deoxy-4-formamido-L-arabinose transferase
MRPLLTILVPLYNSAGTIERLLEELNDLPVDGGCEIVLVNDGSQDATVAICERAMARFSRPITLVKLSRNFGEHNAVMAGLRHAAGEWVINIDDDLQNPPSEILVLLDHARRNGHEVVYSYYLEKQHESWRNLGSWLTNRMADVLLDKPKGLYLSSFRCMSAFVAAEICKYDGPFAYVDGLILQVTQNIGRVPVRHAPREAGRSGYTVSKLVKLWLNTFVNFSVMPLHLATLMGFAMAIVGFLYTLAVVLERYLYGTPLGWSSLMAALLVFSGTELLVVGVAGEYIGRIFLTANKRPQFVVHGIVDNHGPRDRGTRANP